MTGYINYLDREPDPLLLRLRAVWEGLCRDGKLPAFSQAIFDRFGEGKDQASLIEVRREKGKQRYFVAKDEPGVVATVGIDSSGTYLDGPSTTPEFNMMLMSDYDGIVKSRRPRLYAEEHHLDDRVRSIIGIQLPFAADGETVDLIVEFTFPIKG